tara:strand:- start:648 stop:821 length:174 start_codon:yes stop_codon:yes gene_type:complete
MPVLYSQAQKRKYRITLELDVLDDFNPRQIDWDKVFEIQDNESVESYIEDMSNPVRW